MHGRTPRRIATPGDHIVWMRAECHKTDLRVRNLARLPQDENGIPNLFLKYDGSPTRIKSILWKT